MTPCSWAKSSAEDASPIHWRAASRLTSPARSASAIVPRGHRLADVEDRDDVGVRGDPRRRPRLALKPPHSEEIVGEVIGEQLDRHASSEDRVLGAPHGRHSPGRDPC
jgi:hypothetical protein